MEGRGVSGEHLLDVFVWLARDKTHDFLLFKPVVCNVKCSVQ